MCTRRRLDLGAAVLVGIFGELVMLILAVVAGTASRIPTDTVRCASCRRRKSCTAAAFYFATTFTLKAIQVIGATVWSLLGA